MAGMLLGQRAVTGKSLLSGFDNSGPSYAFANLVKMAGTPVPDTANYAFPAVLDSNGYPNNAPGNSLPTNHRMAINIPDAWGNQTLVFKFSGKGALYLQNGGGSNLGYTFDSVPTGTNVVDTSTANLISISGTDVRVTFHFNTSPTNASNYVLLFTVNSYVNMGNLVLCRATDESAITANPNAFNPDFISQLTTLNPKIIRTMDWSGVFGHQSQFSQRAPTGAATFFADRFPPECWVGSASGTGTGIDPYICSLPSTWAGLVDGAAFSVQFTNANTATQPLINVGSTGNVRITTLGPNDLGIGDIAAGAIWTFVYSSVYNYWTGIQGGFQQKVPLEQHVALCNAVNAHLWFNICHRYSPSECTALTSVVKANLKSTLNFYAEVSNEVWNFGNPQTSFIDNVGGLCGFTPASSRGLQSGFAMYHRRMMGAVTTAWGDSGAGSRLKRVMPFQAYGDQGTSGSNNIWRFQGQDLAPSGTHTGIGNSTYNAFTGSADYTQSPNRPIDFADVLSYATYYSGGEIMQFDQNYVDFFNAGKNFNNLTNAADQFAAGGGSISTALAWVDNDLRRGLFSDGSAGTQTLLDLSTNIYPAWETVAASYDASRPGIGLSALTVECYEGGMGAVGPSTGTCTTLGISTAYSAKIGNLIEAYKNNGLFQALVTEQFNQFMAVGTRPKTPAWYGHPGASPWAFFTGSTYTGPPFATPYKSWDANVALNH